MHCGVSLAAMGWVALCCACDGQSDSSRALVDAGPGVSLARQVAKPPAMAAQKVELIELSPSEEPLTRIVMREQKRAAIDGRDLFIYVGAEWCEPCTRFHQAVQRGELDGVFPTLRLLELDRDRDEARLAAAGCITRMIPLFARPTSEGKCDLARSIAGSIKGPGAVANITPRLRRLL